MADLDHEERLKASLHFTVGKMCEEQEPKLQVTFDKHVMATINEILWRQVKIITQDLEAFAKHGKRSTVTLDDSKLLARRNESLRTKLWGSTVVEEPVKVDRGKALVKKRKSSTAQHSGAVNLDAE